MKIFLVLIFITFTSCAHFDPNDLLNPTTTIVKKIFQKEQQ